MDNRPRMKPDDAPVTFGELRQAVALLMDYTGSLGVLMAALTAAGVSNSPESEQRVDGAEKEVRRLLAELDARYAPEEVDPDGD